jgi:two-component system, NarL family, sensor kinase
MKKYIAIAILLFSCYILSAQTILTRDSLLHLLPKAKNDTSTVLLYISIGQQYEGPEPVTAKNYYRKAGELSRKINYPLGIIKFIVNYTYILNMEGLFDSSLLLNLQSVELSRKIKDSIYIAKTLFNTGTSYRLKGEFENAEACYLEGGKIFAKFGNVEMKAVTDDILQNLYFDLKQYERAINYGQMAVTGFRINNDLPGLGAALSNMGLSYVNLRKLDTAAQLFKEALMIALKIGDKYMEQSQYLNLGDILLKQGDYENFKIYMSKALALSKELEAHESELIATRGLSYYYQYKKSYVLSKQYAIEALALSYKYNLRIQRGKLFTHLSNLSYSMQDNQLGEYYATQSSLLGDSILNETIQKNTLELEKKYEAEKKELLIKQLQLDKRNQQLSIRQKNSFNSILIGSLATLLLLSLLSFRTYKQKQKIQHHRIIELETKQHLTATEAVLKGEEQERTRIAKDLHDGLGGLLSGIKYSFTTMKGNLVMTPENHQAFERSLDMLDSSISEMRRVAHNMMPEALVRFGLDTALHDFCNDINQSGALKITYQSFGLENMEIDQTAAITVYRIVQELINNTMKHSGATSAIVQLTKSNGQLSVTVEDDGKGFDTTILSAKKGIGWVNIQNRVEFLKGRLDISSKKGEGTSVHIELFI